MARGIAVAVVAFLVLLVPPGAGAVPFNVTTDDDEVDMGACGALDPDCSLREAIIAANALAGPDTVNVPAGSYVLTIAGASEDLSATGDLDVRQNVDIVGAGAGTTTVNAAGPIPIVDRVFDIGPATASTVAAISGLTITGGRPPAANHDGGGIRANGSLTLDAVVVTDNDAGSNSEGGGVIEFGGNPLTIRDSTISDNTAGHGAGVSENGEGDVVIERSTISGNVAEGAISRPSDGGGATTTGSGTVTIRDSTISGNTARGANAYGGGYSDAGFGTTTISNSTISGNTADGSEAYGGGIADNTGGTFALTNVTIASNRVTGPGSMARHQAGNIAKVATFAGFSFTLKNTIVSAGAPANCAVTAGALTSSGHNLESASTCGFGASADLVNTDPVLGSLQNNGGSTSTHDLGAGSAAIDSADNSACPPADQRGVGRPRGAVCDRGSVEGAPPVLTSPPPPQCSDQVDNDGDGAVDAADPGCLPGPMDNNEGDETERDLVLCGQRTISLVRADVRGRRVVLSGVVAASVAGQRVRLSVRYLGGRGQAQQLGSVTPGADGRFQARVKKPSRQLFNFARYRAQVASARSVELKLPQSLASSSLRQVAGGMLELRGQVDRALLGKRNAVVVKRILCGQYTTVGQAKPNRRGAYAVRFPAPALGGAALYRAESRVLARPGSKRYVRQFARALGITF